MRLQPILNLATSQSHFIWNESPLPSQLLLEHLSKDELIIVQDCCSDIIFLESVFSEFSYIYSQFFLILPYVSFGKLDRPFVSFLKHMKHKIYVNTKYMLDIIDRCQITWWKDECNMLFSNYIYMYTHI